MKMFASCLALSCFFLGPQAVAQENGNKEQEIKRAALKKAQKKEQAAAALQLELPEAAAAIVQQDYTPNPAIWKLTDEDTTIYMFGTFHILPPGFAWRSDAFNAIVAAADELVVETSDDDGDEELRVFMMEVMAQSMNPDRTTISERLSEENREKWFAIADLANMPREFFDRMPLMLSLIGAGFSLGLEQGSTWEHGVETVLEAEFKAADKPIGSIENANDVMAALLAIDEDGLIEELDGELGKWDGKDLAVFFDGMGDVPGNGSDEGPQRDAFKSEHSWAQGILDDLSMEEMKSTEFGRQMYKVLLTDRNRAWARWLEDRLNAPGTVLLAVGAGHFEGADSVQVMLRERGLTAERIH